MPLKDTLRLLTPPLLWHMAAKLRQAPRNPEWEYIPEGWKYAESHPEVKGWNVQEGLNVYKAKWPAFVAMVQGNGPLGVAHESALTTNADIGAQNTIMAFAYALALAAQHKERLSLLDWGGGIGHYYLLAKALLPDTEVVYSCKDVPLLAEYGAHLLPQQHFYSDDSCLERTYDFVLASTSLHYSENWCETLAGLAKATGEYLFVTRLPTLLDGDSYVFIQRPYAYGYNTEYLGWCLNKSEFVAQTKSMNFSLVREFVIDERPPIVNAPEPCQYRGFLFRKSPTESSMHV